MKHASRRKFHYIYKITRLDETGKYYIGMHSTDDLDDGYFGSGSILSKSIKKHGKENHSKEVLEYLESREALKLREKELVNEELLGDKKCMNLKLGGEGGWEHISREQILKSGLLGTAAIKMKWEDEAFRKITKKKMSEAQTNAYIAGRKPTGFRHDPALAWTDVVRSQRSNTRKNNKFQQGEKNSQFGTCWIKNDFESKRIKKELLNEYLEKGYVLGARFKKNTRDLSSGDDTTL